MSLNPTNSVPDRTSSRRPGRTSVDSQRAEEIRVAPLSGTVDKSRTQAPTMAYSEGQVRNGDANQPTSPNSISSGASGQLVGSKSRGSMELAPHDPSPLIPRYQGAPASPTTTRHSGTTNGSAVPDSPSQRSPTQYNNINRQETRRPVSNNVTSTPKSYPNDSTSPRQASSNTVEMLSEHIRLPPGFHIGHREFTEVETSFQPAITKETIIRKQTEIVQEAITRDVHIHHYHTVVQPIHVVEILPAKHYRLDQKTGQRILIDAPQGWEMPSHLQPYSPDLRSMTGSQRHYLVDEEHPNGVLEAPPLHHKDHVPDLRRVSLDKTRP